MNQVYWDIFEQSLRVQSERLGKQIGEQRGQEIGLKLGQEIGQQKAKEAKEAKLKEAARLVNQLLKTGTMPFEQIFSIVTNGYSKEEKELVLKDLGLTIQ